MKQVIVGGKKPFPAYQFIRSLNNPLLWKILIAIMTYGIIFAIMLGAISPERHEIQVGDILREPIRAPRDIENKAATIKKIEQAKQSVSPIYRLNQDVKISMIEDANRIFEDMGIIRSLTEDRIKEWQEKQKSQVTDQNAEEGEDNKDTETSLQANDNQQETIEYDEILDNEFVEQLQANLDGIELSKEELFTCIKAEETELLQLQERLIQILINLFELRIKDENLLEAKNALRDEILRLPISNEVRLLGTTIGVSLLKPNMVYDHDATEAEREKVAQQTEKVIYKKGQYIVQDGQPVTEDQIAVLKDLGLLKDQQLDIPLVIGLGILLLVLELVVILYLFYFEKEVAGQPLKLFMMSLIVCIILGLAYITSLINQYLIPAAMCGLLLAILIKPRVAFIINIALAVLMGVMMRGHSGIIITTLLGSMIGIYLASKPQQRSSLIWTGLVISGANVLTIIGYELVVSGDWWLALQASLWGGGSGILSAVLAVGTLPIWENIFGIITPIRMIELSNPNHPMLKRLLMEAPGTYHHSIIVANLAESAANAVDANGLLARVGAYYHDVGKLKRPYYFRENQLSSDNPHDKLNPNLSTHIITSHTKDGVELAQEYKVPKVLQDFMLQHHGTTPVIYFYHKAKNNGDCKDVRLENFRYKGPRPQSPEIAIVMLADTVEAAVRALPDPTQGKIEGLIRKLIKDKLEDGQLDECHLTLKDLGSIATAFTSVICGVFHERVEYPDVDLNEEREDSIDDN
jgi:putative nucleotidyltransferase with HDIG domain